MMHFDMKGEKGSPSFADIPAESASYYDRNAQMYSDTNQNPADFIDEFLGLLKRQAPDKRQKILDVGSGHGINAEYMHSKHFDIIGIDLSKTMLEYARKKYPHIEFRLGDMTKLPFQNETFDGILASYSVIHLPKDAISGVLAKLNVILKSNGIMYLSVQSGKSSQGFYSHPTIPNDQVFLNIFAKEEILNLLSEHGFEIVSQHEKLPQGRVFNFTKLFIIAKKRTTLSGHTKQ
jgi:ubiquinone/menaquinone biosynthesis C-methylase UbiE